jgi:hypothetical protein
MGYAEPVLIAHRKWVELSDADIVGVIRDGEEE